MSGIDNARGPGDVREDALAVVAIQGVWLARERTRAAERIDVHEPSALGLTAHRHFAGDEPHVVRDVQVDVAVAVVIAKCAPGAPARIRRLPCRGEGAAVYVAPQHVRPECGDI